MKIKTPPTGLLDKSAFLANGQPFFVGEAATDQPLSEKSFLEALARLKDSGTLLALKSGVAGLKNSLTQPGLHAQFFGLSSGYLLKELEQIADCLTLERARYYLERLERGLCEVKTGPINDINMNRWKAYEDIYTDSLWIIDKRDSTGVHRAGYWGNFVPQIPQQMIKRYTKKGELVLDSFVGSGTTLIESQRLGRHSLGIELQPQVAESARQTVAVEPNVHQVTSQVVTADSLTLDYRALLPQYGFNSAQLVIMHPPYFDIIKFSDDPSDLSNAASVETFVAQMGQAVKNATTVLDKGRYLVLVIGDKYSKGEWIPLGFQTMSEVLKLGFSLKGIIVKNFEETTGKRNQKELWRYRALARGLYVFKHEYIFLFQKLG